jgi:hypothetical protein
VLAPRQHQGIDEALAPDPQRRYPLELGVDEAEVEQRVVDDERRIADEGEKVVCNDGEQRWECG